ncbi:amino acid ABC transporter permease [Corynebacterium sp. ES2715-CONJ3]|uniref:amino acid ABC transporter permease n=1 Tax=Corynebacterium sp. ES2715-CONJ3 TaxID=2974028 RepID=UPI002169F5C2|nr:amino acid ABC transporter permease [Corynebacterium sp. ES2715-CONJ3]MCS4490971.1 amino acid ABC transporter permease [Corynebacterium sp. ES2715-CONJ3]
MDALWAQLGPAILPAFWTTIKLTILSALGALAIGTILVSMRVSPIGILRTLATFYINTIRNTPLTLVVLFCSFGLYQTLGLQLAQRDSTSYLVDNNFRLAVIGFTIYTSAFVAECLRAGINTVDFGQAEAARSLGLNFRQTFIAIVFPQAFRAAVVPLGNTLIALTKNTTVASVIGVAEASLLMKEVIEKNANQLWIISGCFALGFMILTIPMGLIVGRVSQKVAVSK